MSHLAEVVTLYDTNPNDVPGMLRDLAEQIESGLHGVDVSVVAILSGSFGIDFKAFGRLNMLEVHGLLSLGRAKTEVMDLTQLEGEEE
jgi:hypothetical protein